MPEQAPSPLPEQVVVRLADHDLHEGLADLRWHLRGLLRSGTRVLVVDLAGTQHLSSTVVAALIGTHRACQARGGRVVLRNPNGPTIELLRRTGLWRVLLAEHPPQAPDRPRLKRRRQDIETT